MLIDLPPQFGTTAAKRRPDPTHLRAELARLEGKAMMLSSTKMSLGDSGPILRLLDRIGERLTAWLDGLFAGEAVDTSGRPLSEAAQRELTAVAEELSTQREALQSQWQDLQAREAQARATAQEIATAVQVISQNLTTRYAAQTAEALSNQLAHVASEADAIVAESDTLANEIMLLEQRLAALEAA